jgi:hypothetical protein
MPMGESTNALLIIEALPMVKVFSGSHGACKPENRTQQGACAINESRMSQGGQHATNTLTCAGPPRNLLDSAASRKRIRTLAPVAHTPGQ